MRQKLETLTNVHSTQIDRKITHKINSAKILINLSAAEVVSRKSSTFCTLSVKAFHCNTLHSPPLPPPPIFSLLHSHILFIIDFTDIHAHHPMVLVCIVSIRSSVFALYFGRKVIVLEKCSTMRIIDSKLQVPIVEYFIKSGYMYILKSMAHL